MIQSVPYLMAEARFRPFVVASQDRLEDAIRVLQDSLTELCGPHERPLAALKAAFTRTPEAQMAAYLQLLDLDTGVRQRLLSTDDLVDQFEELGAMILAHLGRVRPAPAKPRPMADVVPLFGEQPPSE